MRTLPLLILLGTAGCSLVLPPRDTGRVIQGVICEPAANAEDESAETGGQAKGTRHAKQAPPVEDCGAQG